MRKLFWVRLRDTEGLCAQFRTRSCVLSSVGDGGEERGAADSVDGGGAEGEAGAEGNEFDGLGEVEGVAATIDDGAHGDERRGVVGVGHDGGLGHLLAGLGVDEVTLYGAPALLASFFSHGTEPFSALLLGLDSREDLGFGLGGKV